MSATNLQGVYLDPEDRAAHGALPARSRRSAGPAGRSASTAPTSPGRRPRRPASPPDDVRGGAPAREPGRCPPARWRSCSSCAGGRHCAWPASSPSASSATRRMVDARWTPAARLLPLEPARLLRHRPAPSGEPRALRRASRRTASTRSPAGTPGRSSLRVQPPALPRRAARRRSPRASTRVMIFGDSFTEGQGVKEDDTLLARPRAAAERRGTPGRYEVRNCGRRGTRLPGAASRPSRPACSTSPTSSCTRSCSTTPCSRRSSGAPELRQRLDPGPGEPARRGGPAAQPPALAACSTSCASRVAAWRVGRETTRWYLDMWSDANPGWAATRTPTSGRWTAGCGGTTARLLVAPWPLLRRPRGRLPVHAGARDDRTLLPRSRASRTTTCCRPSGAGRIADLWVHPVDRHPNELAQRLAAESLAPVVRRLVEGP